MYKIEAVEQMTKWQMTKTQSKRQNKLQHDLKYNIFDNDDTYKGHFNAYNIFKFAIKSLT